MFLRKGQNTESDSEMRIKKAKYWKKKEKVSICELCIFRCSFAEKNTGKCMCRVCINGEIMTATYAKISKTQLCLTNDIPLINERNIKWFVAGGLGCNLKCPACRFHTIAFSNPLTPHISYREITPEALVKEAEFNYCKGICFSFSEPFMMVEYVLDVFKIAKSKGLKTAVFTNGLANQNPAEDMVKVCNHFIVDIKGFSKTVYKSLTGEWIGIEDVTPFLELIKSSPSNLELVTVVVPRFNNSFFEMKSLIRWIKHRIGKDTPWHIMPFKPSKELYYLNPTSSDTLLKIAELAQKEGLSRVIVH